MAQKEKGTEGSRTDILHRLAHFQRRSSHLIFSEVFFFFLLCLCSLLIALRFLFQGVEPGGKDFAALVHLL